MSRTYRLGGAVKPRALGTVGSGGSTPPAVIPPTTTSYSPTPVPGTSGQVKSFWAANTGRGGSPGDSAMEMVSGLVAGAYVAADGKILTSGNWCENGGELHGYAGDGTTGFNFLDVHPGMGHSCTVDPSTGKAWAASNEHPIGGTQYRGLRRFPWSRSNDEARTTTAGYVHGLAIIGSTAYAACSDGVMRTYNTSTLAPGATWAIPSPSRNGMIAVAGKLALLSGTTVTLYDTSGTQVGFRNSLIDPKGLGVDNRVTPERLIVCQGRGDHRLAVLDTADMTRVVDYFGVEGGVYSSVGDPRGSMLDHSRLILPRAARIFADGSWTVVCSALDVRAEYDALQGGTIIRKLPSKTATTATWSLYGLAFCDAGQFDPNTGVDMFTPNFWHKFDQATGAWAPYAMTLDVDEYPNAYNGGLPSVNRWDIRDQENHDNTTPWLFFISGKRYMILESMYGTSSGKALQAYKPGLGLTFVPCGAPFGNDPSRGLQVMADGTIYMTEGGNKVTRRTLTGLNAQGDPTWSGPVTLATTPAAFNGGSNGGDGNFKRFLYDPATDRAYVSGWSTSYGAGATHDMEKIIGNCIACYTSFSTAGFANLAWITGLPSQDTGNGIRGLQYWIGIAQAGPYLFLVECARMLIRVYRKSDGVLVQEWVPGTNPAAPWTSFAALVAQKGTNAYLNGFNDTQNPGIGVMDVVQGIHAWQAANGVIDISLYDNGAEKVAVMQWTP